MRVLLWLHLHGRVVWNIKITEYQETLTSWILCDNFMVEISFVGFCYAFISRYEENAHIYDMSKMIALCSHFFFSYFYFLENIQIRMK